MRTIKLDILNNGAIYFLKKLEAKNLIRILSIDDDTKLVDGYNEPMSPQSIEEIEKQLNELHKEWN
jgi:hypothetical protein